MARETGEIRIGISGWRYPPWRGVFYPEDLTQKCELHYASRQLRTIEINGSFYSLQRPEYYRRWHDEVPDDFVFSVKGGRYVTHLRRLKEPREPLANFFASGVLVLGRKLGPFLWQLPPMLPFKPDRLEDFLRELPRDTDAAAKLARATTLPNARTLLRPRVAMPLRHALEVRHASFACPEFIALLREHDVGLVVADTAGKWPFMEDVTSDFVYVRLHGDEELYVSGYTPVALDTWEKKIRAWARGVEPRAAKRVAPPSPHTEPRDVFVYFDNDVKVRAPFDAMSLAHRLDLGPMPAQFPEFATDVRPLLAAARERWPGYRNVRRLRSTGRASKRATRRPAVRRRRKSTTASRATRR